MSGLTKLDLIKHHLGQIRDIVHTLPVGRDAAMVLTKSDELEMWAERPTSMFAASVEPEPVNEHAPPPVVEDPQSGLPIPQ